MKKFVMSLMIGIGIITMGFFFGGCKKKTEEYQALTQTEKKLQEKEERQKRNSKLIVGNIKEKYGKEFEILSIDEIQGRTALDETFYIAKVCEAGKQDEFKVYWYPKKELQQDTYAKIIYKREIEEIEEMIVANGKKFTKFSYEICYREEEKNWEKEEFETYLSESDTYIDLECSMETMEAKEAAEALELIINKLRESGMKYYFRSSWKEKNIYLNEGMDEKAVEDIIKEIKNSQENEG